MDMMEESGNDKAIAVMGQNVYKSYGRRKSKCSVLRNLDIRVPQRSIYGLLGPSGCGKTTLLRCILGRLQVNSGQIIVLGEPPNTPGHGIPGKRVGYMPQETALFGEFSLKDHLMYFGRLHGMNKREIKSRTEFLIRLLKLPEPDKLNRELSGGQQRRVSFAVALLQEPPLLILDEPTVGVDPLLRAGIWKHLRDVVTQTNTTIMITTHYIEEARQADMVGLMRDGRILAEAPPDELMESHCSATLEDVFLNICEGIDADSDVRGVSITEMENASTHLPPSERTPLLDHDKSSVNDDSGKSILEKSMELMKDWCSCPSWSSLCQCQPLSCSKEAVCKGLRNSSAVIWKNVTKFRRNLGLLLFQFLLPVTQICFFCLAIGGNPTDLTVSVVNQDSGILGINMGNMFIQCLDSSTMHKENVSSVAEARHQVIEGHSWALIHIGPSFSEDMFARITEGFNVSNAMLDGSTIKIAMDTTNEQITVVLMEKFQVGFEEFSKEAMIAFKTFMPNANPNAAASPVQFEPPIYGHASSKFTYYVAPGIIVSISFGMAIALTAITFVIERKEGLLDRSWVAGVNVVEVVLSHAITQLFIIIVQMALLVIVTLYAFKIPCEGNVMYVLLLAILQGLTGMSCGLLISAVCDTELAAVQVAMGLFYPTLVLSGIIWPVEAMPLWLRDISYGLPTMYAAKSMRSIMGRGWGLDWQVVWTGYLITIGWFLLLLFLSAVGLKRQK